MAEAARIARQLTGGNLQEGGEKGCLRTAMDTHHDLDDNSEVQEEAPVSVCMIGTGEYTTGYVHGGASDSDKGAGGGDGEIDQCVYFKHALWWIHLSFFSRSAAARSSALAVSLYCMAQLVLSRFGTATTACGVVRAPGQTMFNSSIIRFGLQDMSLVYTYSGTAS